MRLAALLNPALAWLALLFLVPLIIHLLNRRRYKRISWAAMDFVLAAYKKKHRRMRVENLLLLLIRCAIPAVLAFAAARPFFGADSPMSMLGESRRNVVVILDVSYSMNRVAGTTTLFESAQSQIQSLVRSLRFDQGEGFTLIALSREPRVLVQGSSSLSDLDRALSRIPRPDYEPADFGLTMDLLVNKVLPELPGVTEVLLFSDFQRRTFERELQGEPGETTAEAVSVRSLLQKLVDQGTSLRFVNLTEGTPTPGNARVVDLRCAEPLVIVHQSVRLTAHVVRQETSAGRGSGFFRIDGKERSIAFEFDKQGEATVEVFESFAEAGDHAVEFHLEDDELADDNAALLRVVAQDSIKLLLVDGDPIGSDPLSGELRVLLPMLDPQYGEAAGDNVHRLFEAQPTAHQEFNRGDVRLDEYQAVVLANVREIDEQRVRELTDYAARGGGVWFFMGDQVRPDSYNQRLYSEGGKGLLPIPLRSEPAGDVPSFRNYSPDAYENWHRLQIVDDLHPAMRESVEESRRQLLRSAAVYRYLGFEDAKLPDSAHVIARFERGQEIAYLDQTIGLGRVLWFSSSADEDWGFLALAAQVFFPFIYDGMSCLVTRDASTHRLRIGDAIRRSVPAAPEPYTITLPGGEKRLIEDLPTTPHLGHFPLQPFTDTRVPGLYQLDVGLGAGEDPIHELFAVNVDPAEGDLGAVLREELTVLMGKIPFDYGLKTAEGSIDDEPRRQGEIWKTLMGALLVLLLLETLLAWRFGAYR